MGGRDGPVALALDEQGGRQAGPDVRHGRRQRVGVGCLVRQTADQRRDGALRLGGPQAQVGGRGAGDHGGDGIIQVFALEASARQTRIAGGIGRHQRQVSACRPPEQDDARRIDAVAVGVGLDPTYGAARVNQRRGPAFAQAVLDVEHDVALPGQPTILPAEDVAPLVALEPRAAVQHHDRRAQPLGVRRLGYVQAQRLALRRGEQHVARGVDARGEHVTQRPAPVGAMLLRERAVLVGRDGALPAVP